MTPIVMVTAGQAETGFGVTPVLPQIADQVVDPGQVLAGREVTLG
jgi:hypothetical protein